MRRNAPTGLKTSEAEIRKAVASAAQRSGLSPEGFLARVETEVRRRGSLEGSRLAGDLDALIREILHPAGHPSAAPGAGGAACKDSSRTAPALDSVATWIEQSQEGLDDSFPDSADRRDHVARSFSQALGTITDRLGTVELRTAKPPAQTVDRVLVDTLATLRADLAKFGRRLDEPGPWFPALEAIERELDRVRDNLDGVATREEIVALEAHIRALMDDFGRSIGAESIAALTGTVAALQSQQQRIATELSEGLHRKIAAAMDAVSAKIERVAASGAGRDSVEALERQIGQLRNAFVQSAGHERVERLASEVTALGHHIADLQAQQAAPADMTAVGEALDDIRASIRRCEEEAGATGIQRQLESLSRRVDLLMSRAETPALARMDERLADLAGHMKTLADGSAQSSESIAVRVDKRLADFAEQFDSLARAGATSAQSVADRLQDEADRITAPMRSLSDRIEDLDGRLGTLATDIAKPSKLATERMSKLAGRLETLASAAEPLATISQRMDQGLAGLHDHLATLASDIASPVDTLAGRLDDRLAGIARPVQVLAERVDERLAGLSKPLRALTERVDQRLAGLDERLEALTVAQGEPAQAITERLKEGLAHLTARLASTIEDGAKPVRAVAERVDRLSGEVSALSAQVGTVQGPLVERLDRIQDGLREASAGPKALSDRLDRLEECLREVGDHADTLPLELMMRSLQDRFDRMPSGSNALEGFEERLTSLLQGLNLSAAEPVQQALTETLSHVRGLRGEAAIIAERAAKAVMKEMPLASAADLEAMRQGFAELKALQANAERKTQATLKAVHNALETLVMRMPSGTSIVPAAGAQASDSPAARLEAAVRKLHAAALSHTEDATAAPAQGPDEAEEILLDPATPRNALVQFGASFTAPQESGPGSVRSSFIAAARRAAQAATAESAASSNESAEASGKAPISNQSLIERIRQTFDGHRRPLLFGAALLMAAGSIPAVNGFRGERERIVAQPETGAASLPKLTASSEGPAMPEPLPETTASLLAPPTAAAMGVPVAAALEAGTALARPAALGSGEAASVMPATLSEAALAGDPASLFEVASRLAEGKGLAQDLGLAVKLFQRAAEAGLVPAQFRLGNLYDKGVGVPRDPALARSWYERAAAAGNTQAMHNLGVLHAEGAQGKPDYGSAVTWFKEASEHGVRDSQYNLAVLLGRGVGARQDLQQSYKWFALVAANGDEDARKKRDEVAGRLAAADLAAAKGLVARWRPRPVNAAANEVAPPAQDWTAAPARAMSHRS
jgi:localization factor PodJL